MEAHFGGSLSAFMQVHRICYVSKAQLWAPPKRNFHALHPAVRSPSVLSLLYLRVQKGSAVILTDGAQTTSGRWKAVTYARGRIAAVGGREQGKRKLHRRWLERKRVRAMSGGIARGRLAEERKQWRKNHPHVRPSLSPPSTNSCFLSLSLYVACDAVADLLRFAPAMMTRASLRGPRLSQTAPSI